MCFDGIETRSEKGLRKVKIPVDLGTKVVPFTTRRLLLKDLESRGLNDRLRFL